MTEKCNNCDHSQACVPFYLHENAMMHYNRANKRMLVALISVLAFVAIMISIFVYGNTVREKQLIDMAVQQRITEVQDVKEASPPGV